jgi:acetyltransferase-like isoleucine patch superfamily enzyme
VKPIVSPHSRIRHPEHFTIGDYSIVDDFCYISTRVRIGLCSHIASGCSIAGGLDYLFTLGDFCSLSSGVKIWCASDDFANDIVCIPPAGAERVKQHPIAGDVVFGHYTAVGANSVVMPGTTVPEGTVVGALSFVPPRASLEPWTVYAGVPVRQVGERNRSAVTEQAARMREHIDAARRRLQT